MSLTCVPTQQGSTLKMPMLRNQILGTTTL